MVCPHCSLRLLVSSLPSPARAIPAFHCVVRYSLDVCVPSALFPASSCVVHLTFWCRSVPFSRFIAHHSRDVSVPPVPFSSFVARCSPDIRVCTTGFAMGCALLIRRLFSSILSPVLSRVAHFALTVLSNFRRYYCIRQTIWLFWRFARQTVILGFKLNHLWVVCAPFY